MKELEKQLQYKFKDISLLRMATTHSSYSNEKHGKFPSYERLEFLGDSVLGMIVSGHIFNANPGMPEGELTKLRASLVCEKSLSAYAAKLKVGEKILLGKGEMALKGYERPSILCDVFESVLAAIFIDGGLDEAKNFVFRVFGKALDKKTPVTFKDYKTILQEITQRNPEERVDYRIISESGPDHEKHFVCEVWLNSNVIGKGGGKSKKESEQNAAHKALNLMGYK